MRRVLLVALLLATGAACTNILPATREEAYEFRAFYGADGYSYQWPRTSMPLKIWVDPTSPLYTATKTAIQRWQDALLYGEFRGVIVSDSSTADVIVHNSPPGVEDPGLVEMAMSSECTGITDQFIDFDARTLTLPVMVYIFSNGNQDAAALTRCYSRTATHELGHALGISNHSPNPADIMYRDPAVDELSVADKATMEEVFHTIPNLTIVR